MDAPREERRDEEEEEEEEEEMESGGRGERDEQSPRSVYLQCCCFCSELTRMDTRTQLDKHTLTYTLGSLRVRCSSVDPP